MYCNVCIPDYYRFLSPSGDTSLGDVFVLTTFASKVEFMIALCLSSSSVLSLLRSNLRGRTTSTTSGGSECSFAAKMHVSLKKCIVRHENVFSNFYEMFNLPKVANVYHFLEDSFSAVSKLTFAIKL